jgi:hypothetical protein
VVESSNAWERAQEAIARASERSDEVITPDNAVSPFDASTTTVIPHADVVRRGPPDPDSTQRLPHGRPPAPRRPGDGNGHGPPGQYGNGQHGNGQYGQHGNGRPGQYEGRHGAPAGPPPRPPELSDPSLPRVATGQPGTSPFPAADPYSSDPYSADTGTPPHGFAAAEERPHRPWWKRLLGL